MPARAALEDVTLARGGRPVLRGVTMTVPARGVTTVVGPSGAGKSTLLRCLVRFEEPTGGRVLVDGEDVRALDPPALRRRLGLVAQAPAMLPGTVAENLAYGLPAGEAPAPGVLERAGLDGSFAARAAGSLSGGEAMRVAIARALARRPAALLLDEPTAALDADTAAALARSLRRLAQEGLTVLAVMHDVPLARSIADHAVRVAGGRVVAEGPAGEVLG